MEFFKISLISIGICVIGSFAQGLKSSPCRFMLVMFRLAMQIHYDQYKFESDFCASYIYITVHYIIVFACIFVKMTTRLSVV